MYRKFHIDSKRKVVGLPNYYPIIPKISYQKSRKIPLNSISYFHSPLLQGGGCTLYEIPIGTELEKPIFNGPKVILVFKI